MKVVDLRINAAYRGRVGVDRTIARLSVDDGVITVAYQERADGPLWWVDGEEFAGWVVDGPKVAAQGGLWAGR